MSRKLRRQSKNKFVHTLLGKYINQLMALSLLKPDDPHFRHK
jgi:hypothetical protein